MTHRELRSRSRLCVLACAVLTMEALTACTAPAEPVEPPLEPATEGCLTGVWHNDVHDFGPGRNCIHCELSPRLTTPECDALDCVEANVVAFREDGVRFAGLWRWSDATRSMSFVADYCPPASTSWRIEEPGTLVVEWPVDVPDTVSHVDCSASRIVYDDDRRRTHVRGPPGFTAGVLGMLERSDCVSAPFEPP